MAIGNKLAGLRIRDRVSQSRVILSPILPGEEPVAVTFVQKYYREDHLKFDSRVEAAVKDLISHPEWGSLYCILHDRQPVGYLGLTYGYDHEVGGRFGTITDFWIEPQFRGKGVGTLTLENIAELARTKGLKEIGLVVLDHNERVRPLYERLHFRPEVGRSWMWRTLVEKTNAIGL